jgi:hypothetical protein
MRLSFVVVLFVVLCYTALECASHWCDADHIRWSDDGTAVNIPVGCGSGHDDAINLSFGRLGSRAIEVLAIAMEESVATRLILEGNQIGHGGAVALAVLLSKNTRLLSLDLSNNQIGDEGARAIAQGLRNNTHLRKLMLGNNGIGPRGAAAVALAIGDGRTLLGVDEAPQGTAGGGGGGGFGGAAAQANKYLTSLWLSYNPIGDGGGVILGEALSGNTTFLDDGESNGTAEGVLKLPRVEKLFLAHCGVSNYGGSALGSALVANPHIDQLVLMGNPVSVVPLFAYFAAQQRMPYFIRLLFSSCTD